MNRILINKIRHENAEQRNFAGALDNCLLKYPGLESLARNSLEIRDARRVMIDLYQGKKRLSKRFVMEHCLKTAETVSLTPSIWYENVSGENIELITEIVSNSGFSIGVTGNNCQGWIRICRSVRRG